MKTTVKFNIKHNAVNKNAKYSIVECHIIQCIAWFEIRLQ